MDSTLLDQIRHLCRDRAAYEKLKAILVQQERVYQLSREDRYENSSSQQESSSDASDIFKNIIAREKGLAQLADAIQRSPSLELVLQVAVQVTQKLLQVDRVAIFRRHSDGRSEFITDAIATGIKSLAEMPERQLLLSQHMLESAQSDQFTQTIEGIRGGNLSHHLSTLLEQINISSYAANKIYAGHECWGVLVAFHGSVYHVWSESDRTSLSLVAAQIGIAISLADLRSQSHTLTDDLQKLQIELESLQQVVTELAQQQNLATAIASPQIESISEEEITIIQDPEEELVSKLVNELIDESVNEPIDEDELVDHREILEPISDCDSDISDLSDESEELIEVEVIDSSSDIDSDIHSESEELSTVEIIDRSSDSLSDIPSDIPSDSGEDDTTPQLDEKLDEQIDGTVEEDDTTPQLDEDDLEEEIEEDLDAEVTSVELETNLEEPNAIAIADVIPDSIPNADPIPTVEQDITPSPTVPTLDLSNLSTPENSEINEIDDDDREPAIEPHFMETILTVAGNDSQGIQFLVDVIDNYLEETPRLVQAIDKAIAVNDQPRLLHILNRLRISSDYVGALPLAYQCRQLEAAVKANYVVLMYASLSQVAIEAQRATNAIRIERVRYAMIMDSYNQSSAQ